MRYFFQVLMLLTFGISFHSFSQDTLWVKKLDGKPYVIHRSISGETVFMLAKKYAVPPAILADANNLSYGSGMEQGSKIWIPIDNYNFIRVEGIIKSQPIFYKVLNGDELDDVSRMVNVSQSTVQRWNELNQSELKPGSVLQIGWISLDPEQKPFPDKKISNTSTLQTGNLINPAPNSTDKPTIKKDTNKQIVQIDSTTLEGEDNAYEDLYNEQIMGQAGSNESGAAVFYPLKLKAAPGVYYAFHNIAAKGTIIKVTNPSNDKFIYAKVIGRIPNLKDYNNSIIAISTNAAKELMAKEKRMFCKLEYR